ncbi:MAG: hypothetical protein GXP15_16510 [Gammaproteobacteria bacterium]|nr:hypothetical protein [Gammaproteobacteria bacterium]
MSRSTGFECGLLMSFFTFDTPGRQIHALIWHRVAMTAGWMFIEIENWPFALLL